MPPDYDDVRKEIDQLEQRFAENSQGLVFAHLADAYRRAGEYAKAEGLILHGLKNHPNYISAYNVLGRVYLDSERFTDAHEQFSKVLELDPHNLIALRALGDLAVEGGNPEEARSWYERMLLVDPRNDQVREEIRKLESAATARPSEPAEEEPEEVPQTWLEPEAEADELPGLKHDPDSAPMPEIETEALSLDAEDLGVLDEEQPWEIVDVLERKDDLTGADLVVEPVEGLVTKESMSKLERDVAAAEPRPWDAVPEEEEPETSGAEESLGEPEAESLADAVEEPVEFLPPDAEDTATPAGEEVVADSFLDDTLDIDFDTLDDWTAGLFDMEERAETVESDSAIEDLASSLGLDFGEETTEPEAAVPQTEAPEAAPPEPDVPKEAREHRPAGGMVTETLARVYADQGLYEDALRVYRQLAEARPEDEYIQARITELEQQLSGLPAADKEIEELAQLLDMTEPTPPTPSEVISHEAPPEPAEEPALSAQATEPSAAPIEPLEGEFQFEDEAPVAGFEMLDPFAASFDVLARREMREALEAGEAEPAAEEPAAEEREVEEAWSFEPATTEAEPQGAVLEMADLAPEPEGPAEPDTPEQLAEPALADALEPEFAIESELISSDEAEGAAEAEAVVSSEEEAAGDEEEKLGWEPGLMFDEDWGAETEPVSEVEGPTVDFLTSDEEGEEPPPERVVDDVAAAVISAADVTPPSEAEPPAVEIVELDESVEPVGAMTAQESKSAEDERVAVASTIEDYLSRLLAHVPGQPHASQEPRADEPPAQADEADPGDIEEFQDWLRSLKR